MEAEVLPWCQVPGADNGGDAPNDKLGNSVSLSNDGNHTVTNGATEYYDPHTCFNGVKVLGLEIRCMHTLTEKMIR